MGSRKENRIQLKIRIQDQDQDRRLTKKLKYVNENEIKAEQKKVFHQ